MKSQYYSNLITKTYSEALSTLKDKYGAVPGNYFVNESCKSKNSKITRTKNGLYIHHDKENIALKLSDPKYAQNNPFEYQLAKNLTYCNIFEHLILHYLIYQETKGELSFPGMTFTMLEANALYENEGGSVAWRQNCYNVIKDDFEDYIEFLSEFLYPIYANSMVQVPLCAMDIRDMNIISQKVSKALSNYKR